MRNFLRVSLAAAALIAGLLFSSDVYADGAFPDSTQILLPADRPHDIILATNFGLIVSEDDGATWSWVCEPDPNDNTIFYQLGAPPQDRLFTTLLRAGLLYSDDGACGWTPAGGSLATAPATDVFPDPTHAARVLAIAAPRGDAAALQALFASDDGGQTFGPALYTAPPSGGLLGVEIARSDPMVVYLSTYETPGVHPILARSADGGATWTTIDLAAAIGSHGFRIVAVDPADPNRLYLRVTESLADKLAVSTDGGQSFTEPVSVDQQLTAFARLASGTVLVGGLSSTGAAGFRSADGGLTFQPWPGVPHLRALAERDGKLYAAADNFNDHFAVGVSSDEGLTFQPLLTFGAVMRIKPCAQERCRDTCDNQAGTKLWPPAVCAAAVTVDAGRDHPDDRQAASSHGGCGCRAAPPGSAGGPRALGLALLAAAVALLRRHRR